MDPQLHASLAMDDQLRAELADRRAARRHTQDLERLREEVIKADGPRYALPLLPHGSAHGIFSDDHHVYVGTISTAGARREIAELANSRFRKRVKDVLDVIDERCDALAEMLIEAELVELDFSSVSGWSTTRVRLIEPRSSATTAIATAATRLCAAIVELRERIELETLREDRSTDSGWLIRHRARRDAARQLTDELALFLAALDELETLSEVELRADQLLAARRDAEDDVETASVTS
jgi:hypothetical protein